jgi:hypothetical protein
MRRSEGRSQRRGEWWKEYHKSAEKSQVISQKVTTLFEKEFGEYNESWKSLIQELQNLISSFRAYGIFTLSPKKREKVCKIIGDKEFLYRKDGVSRSRIFESRENIHDLTRIIRYLS